VVVGRSDAADGFSRIVRWKDGVIQDLSATIGPKTWGLAVSDKGSVIGGTNYGGITTAIVWVEESGAVNLLQYLAAHNVTVPSNYNLEYIYAISGDGRTFGGYARHTDTNKTEGFVARLPGAGGGCIPDCDESGQLNIDDFICFQTYFALGDAKADCDGTGGLDIDDFICFQTFFSLGC